MKKQLNIQPFNPAILEKRIREGSPPTIVLLGKRRTGKTTLVIDLLWHMKIIPIFIAMSGTEDGNHFYSKFFHPLSVHGEYKADVVEKLISKQKEKLMECDRKGINTEKRYDLGIGLLLDDCGYKGRKIMGSESISQIFQNGRHWKICFIVSLQYMMGLPPEARTNIDYVFALRENITVNQKKLYDNFFGIFPKFAQFQEAFTECTEDHHCMVLDNTAGSNKVNECVFWYKATFGRQFRIGSPALWNYLNSRYDPTKKEDDDIATQRNSGICVKKVPVTVVKTIQPPVKKTIQKDHKEDFFKN